VSPYRERPTTRWVCLGCYAHISDVGGLCRNCEIDLLPLDDAAVRDELRAEAERRFQNKGYGEAFALILLSVAVTLPLALVVSKFIFVVGVLVAPVLMKVFTKAWILAQPDSATALIDARRARLRYGAQPKLLPAHDTKKGKGDPEALDIEGTVRWLGIDEPKR